MVAGEMVMVIFVTGSVHVELEVVVEAVEVEVVQVIAVLKGAAPHEASPSAAASKITNRRLFTAPLYSTLDIPNAFGSLAT
jgi:hypothetical protein